MARANRHYAPGLIWHITHRCHKRDFLLKFDKDKHAWLRWMLEAKKRYGLCVLNYTLTSNHVHFQVREQSSKADGATGDGHIPSGRAKAQGEGAIARSLQLVAGRVAQEYNDRKERRGAFWEDRYHATAVETGDHFVTSLSYIDMNMVRAGVVAHPAEWPFGAFYELVRPRKRFRNQLVDWDELLDLLGMGTFEQLRRARQEWAKAALLSDTARKRDPKWTESVAVGSKAFLDRMVSEMGVQVIGRKVIGEPDAGGNRISNCDKTTFVIREVGGEAYLRFLEAEKDELRPLAGLKRRINKI